jgi:Tfp pilus assembly protein PilZ
MAKRQVKEMLHHRKNTRTVCVVPVDGKEGSVFDRTHAVDFSRGGLGFVSGHRIPVNKKIPIEINLSDEGVPVFVIGRVKWVQPIPESKSFRIGVTFTDVLPGSKSRLVRYFREQKAG